MSRTSSTVVTADHTGSRPTGRSTTPAPGPSGATAMNSTNSTPQNASGHESLEGVARDATTLLDVLHALAERGFKGEFAVRGEGTIECLTCRRAQAARAFHVRALRRLEGASDPADMLAVAALACPNCGTEGTLVVNYGPLASTEDADALRDLEEPPPPSPDLDGRGAG